MIPACSGTASCSSSGRPFFKCQTAAAKTAAAAKPSAVQKTAGASARGGVSPAAAHRGFS